MPSQHVSAPSHGMSGGLHACQHTSSPDGVIDGSNAERLATVVEAAG